MASSKSFLDTDHHQLLHEVQMLRESEARVKAKVRQLQDENDEMRRCSEGTYSTIKDARIQSITPGK
jgi:hypothetical protein